MNNPQTKQSRHSRASGRVTIVDVARLARVSPMTVSRALKTPALVQLKARERITAAVKQLDYVPNQAASTLASAKSQVIGVIIPSLNHTAFFTTLTGIRDSLHQHGYQFLIGESGYSPEKESQLITTYLAHAPDGFLLSGIEQQQTLRQQLAMYNVPSVCMFDLISEGNQVTVGFSHEQAGSSIARHLIERGYRRPGFLGAQLDLLMMKRKQGFQQVLTEAGIIADAEVLTPAPATVELGSKMLGQMLQKTPECDAVFCCNDEVALGALFECQRRGLSVPGQMAIAGFNDLPWSAHTNPSLTTVVTPRYEIGFTAAQLLVKIMRREAIEKTKIDLGFQLVVREST